MNKDICFECGSNNQIEYHHVVPQVMGGTKTGTIISKMGEEGFRIQVGNGFATVKKSAIV